MSRKLVIKYQLSAKFWLLDLKNSKITNFFNLIKKTCQTQKTDYFRKIQITRQKLTDTTNLMRKPRQNHPGIKLLKRIAFRLPQRDRFKNFPFIIVLKKIRIQEKNAQKVPKVWSLSSYGCFGTITFGTGLTIFKFCTMLQSQREIHLC